METPTQDLAVPAPVGMRVETLLRRTFAAACILGLAGIGVSGAWLARPDVQEILIWLAATLAPATAYAFGYFRCLPDVLGAPTVAQKQTLGQRWSDFARLSAVISICLTVTSWGFGIWSALSSGRRADAIMTLLGILAVTSVMAGCVVASEEYLARTTVRGNAIGGSGWRVAARRLVGRWGARVVKPLGAKRSLTLGSVLALCSLILTTTVQFGCSDIPHRGYEILSGRGAWVTAESAEAAALKVIVAQAGRWAYALGLAISVLVLAVVLTGGAGAAARRSRSLEVFMGSLGLFFICDYTFAWARFGSKIMPEGVIFTVQMMVWILPIALWLWRARGAQGGWHHTRLAVMVLYLPIFFASLYWLIFLASNALGYIFFVMGMLLVWWGLVQSRGEATSQP